MKNVLKVYLVWTVNRNAIAKMVHHAIIVLVPVSAPLVGEDHSVICLVGVVMVIQNVGYAVAKMVPVAIR